MQTLENSDGLDNDTVYTDPINKSFISFLFINPCQSAMRAKRFVMCIVMSIAISSCSTNKTAPEAEVPGEKAPDKIKLIILDPGHFHAALVQKSMLKNVDSVVHVFAPEGDDVLDYLKRIEAYNNRPESPTRWKEEIYKGPDYFGKMLAEKPGNVVVLAGNNKLKTRYIKSSIDSGLNVFADKPMAINSESFELLKEAFAAAEKNDLLLYDIMTERFEITTLLQREFSRLPEVFGDLQKGTAKDPAVTKESVHHFSKLVSGAPLIRPAWFFDVGQQGEGIVDVTTHLVDLVQWECFPDQAIDYQSDINITSARHWKTNLNPAQFEKVTGLKSYPEYLKKDISGKNVLGVYSNGEINYQIKGVHAKVSVIWNFEAPPGAADTHFSIMKGSKANLIIRQGKEQHYKPLLYIEPVSKDQSFESHLKSALTKIQANYPGVDIKREGHNWAVLAPEKYHNGHEAHFGQVAEKYLEYLEKGNMPAWEVPNMITKYFITTRALEMARKQ
jgi:predicted dehydrogenase